MAVCTNQISAIIAVRPPKPVMSKVIMAATVLTFAKALSGLGIKSSIGWNLAACRCLSTSSLLLKNIRAGSPKATPLKNKPLTYEEAQKPHYVGVRKSWNSWNTSNLEGMNRHTGQTTYEDIFIRQFVTGTWPGLLASNIIVKRRQNMIVVAGLITRQLLPRKVYFLIGYTEQMLALILKRPVKLELQTVESKRDTVFKYI